MGSGATGLGLRSALCKSFYLCAPVSSPVKWGDYLYIRAVEVTEGGNACKPLRPAPGTWRVARQGWLPSVQVPGPGCLASAAF